MKSSDLIRPLAHRFNWMANRIIPECTIDGGIADLLVISKAGYLTEIEIKVSFSDWHADPKKDKWRHARENVCRFFYAVPEELAGRIPGGLPEGSGILVCRAAKTRGGLQIEQARPAVRRKTRKLTRLEILELSDCMYYRWWRERFKRMPEEGDHEPA